MYEVVLVSTLTGTGLTFFSILAASRSQSRASFRFPTTAHLQDLWVAWMYQCFPDIWYLWVAWMYQSFMIFRERWIWLEVRILVTSLVHLDVSLLFHCLPSPDIGWYWYKTNKKSYLCGLLLSDAHLTHIPLPVVLVDATKSPVPATAHNLNKDKYVYCPPGVFGWTGSSLNNIQSWAESFILSFHLLPDPWPKLLFHVGDPAHISVSTSL